jgi:hypothetical protein
MNGMTTIVVRPGFVFVEAEDEACGLIFGDDRGRSVQVELVVEANLHLVLLYLTAPVQAPAKEAIKIGQRGEEIIPDRAPIAIAVFGPNRPIVGDGVLDTAADRPAHAGIREAIRGEKRRAIRGVAVNREVGIEARRTRRRRCRSQATPRRPRIEPCTLALVLALTLKRPPKKGREATAVLLRLVPSTVPSRPKTHWLT